MKRPIVSYIFLLAVITLLLGSAVASEDNGIQSGATADSNTCHPQSDEQAAVTAAATADAWRTALALAKKCEATQATSYQVAVSRERHTQAEMARAEELYAEMTLSLERVSAAVVDLDNVYDAWSAAHERSAMRRKTSDSPSTDAIQVAKVKEQAHVELDIISRKVIGEDTRREFFALLALVSQLGKHSYSNAIVVHTNSNDMPAADAGSHHEEATTAEDEIDNAHRRELSHFSNLVTSEFHGFALSEVISALEKTVEATGQMSTFRLSTCVSCLTRIGNILVMLEEQRTALRVLSDGLRNVRGLAQQLSEHQQHLAALHDDQQSKGIAIDGAADGGQQAQFLSGGGAPFDMKVIVDMLKKQGIKGLHGTTNEEVLQAALRQAEALTSKMMEQLHVVKPPQQAATTDAEGTVVGDAPVTANADNSILEVEPSATVFTLCLEFDGKLRNNNSHTPLTTVSRIALPFDSEARTSTTLHSSPILANYPSIIFVDDKSLSTLLAHVTESVLLVYSSWDARVTDYLDALEHAFPPPHMDNGTNVKRRRYVAQDGTPLPRKRCADVDNDIYNNVTRDAVDEGAYWREEAQPYLYLGSDQFTDEFDRYHRTKQEQTQPKQESNDSSVWSRVSPVPFTGERNFPFAFAKRPGGASRMQQQRLALDVSLNPTHFPMWKIDTTPALVFVREAHMIAQFGHHTITPHNVRRFAFTHTTGSIYMRSFYQLHTMLNENEELAVLFVLPQPPGSDGGSTRKRNPVAQFYGKMLRERGLRSAIQEIMPVVLVDEGLMPDVKPLSWATHRSAAVESTVLTPFGRSKHLWDQIVRNFTADDNTGGKSPSHLIVFRKVKHGSESLLGKFVMYTLCLPSDPHFHVDGKDLHDRELWKEMVASSILNFVHQHQGPILSPLSASNINDVLQSKKVRPTEHLLQQEVNEPPPGGSRTSQEDTKSHISFIRKQSSVIIALLSSKNVEFDSTWQRNESECEKQFRQGAMLPLEGAADEGGDWSFHRIGTDSSSKRLARYLTRTASAGLTAWWLNAAVPQLATAGTGSGGGLAFLSSEEIAADLLAQRRHFADADGVAAPDIAVCHLACIDVGLGDVRRLSSTSRNLRSAMHAFHDIPQSSFVKSTPKDGCARGREIEDFVEEPWYLRLISASGFAQVVPAPLPALADVKREDKRRLGARQRLVNHFAPATFTVLHVQLGSKRLDNICIALAFSVRSAPLQPTEGVQSAELDAGHTLALLVVDGRCGLSVPAVRAFAEASRCYSVEFPRWRAANIAAPLHHFDVVEIGNVPLKYRESHVLGALLSGTPAVPAPTLIVANVSTVLVLTGITTWNVASILRAVRLRDFLNHTSGTGNAAGSHRHSAVGADVLRASVRRRLKRRLDLKDEM